MPAAADNGEYAKRLQDTMPIHLQDMFQRAAQAVTDPTQLAQVAELLIQHQGIFSKDDADLGMTHLVEHTIETGDARPVKQPPRKVPIALAGEEKKAIDQMLKQNIIQESCSPWASPVVLVRKKNGKIRLCIDYRKLNLVTIKDAYPLPTTQECLDAMAGSQYFSSLDMTSGYNQIPLRERDIPKTAFVTKQGLYEFKVMSFGLTNAPATFQRVMELALRGLQWSTCLIYLDDVLIFGATFDMHLERLKQVLNKIKAANLKLKPEKCSLFQSQVPFLGHIVSKQGVQPNPDNVAKILNWSEPTNVTEVRQFLGLCSYYRRFIQDFAAIAKPLTELTCDDSPLVWTDQCQFAFDRLKAKITGPDIMAYPRDDTPFILDTDACDVGIGAVLSQVQDGHERVISYASRSLNGAERNYCVTDKELLAIKNFVEHFKQYLLGREFLVRTDHQALKWLFSLKEPKGRIARWIEILSAYHFTVEYRAGKKHGNADGMSRHPSHEEGIETLACGPCTKCQKRSEDMQSAWCDHGQVRRADNRTSLSAEGEPVSSFPTLALSVVLAMVLCVILTSKQVFSTLGKITEKIGDLLGFNILPVGENGTKPNKVFSQVRDDGRLWPKLPDFHKLRKLLKWNSSQVPDSVGKVETRSSTRSPMVRAWFQSHTQDELIRAQNEDCYTRQVAEWLQSDNRPLAKQMHSASPELRHYWNLWGSLELSNGLIHRRFHKRNGSSSHLQMLVPKSLRQEVLRACHDSVWSGHLSRKKTAARVFQRCYWYEFREDVDLWVSQCDICAISKPATKKPKVPLGDMQVGAPLDRLSIDILGPLPRSEQGNRYILVVCDAFTKWAEAFPIPDQAARTCATVLVDHVISKFGCPLDLHSDQGRNFESEIFKEMCDILQIRKTRTSPHHPQCNGQCERFNRTLLAMIRSFIKGEQEQWDRYLSCLTAAYRATPHESTGLTPNLMMLGREVRLPEVAPLVEGDPMSPGNHSTELRTTLARAHELARQHLHRAARKRSSQHDIKLCAKPYKPGDLVWYLTENRKEGISPKLQPLFQGPCLVLNKLSELDYRIQLDHQGTIKVVHHDKLKRYEGNRSLAWASRALQHHT